MTEESILSVEFIYCGCGCGKTRSKYDSRNEEKKYVNGHQNKGKKLPYTLKAEKNHNWKGGKVIDDHGYIKIRCEGHPRATKYGNYVFEHILVMEKHLGRYLTLNEEIHHKDHNRQNNNISNLILMTTSDHSKLHNKEKREKLELNKRLCSECGNKTKKFRIDKNGYRSPEWMRSEKGWLCGTCWHRFYMRKWRSSIKRNSAKGL